MQAGVNSDQLNYQDSQSRLIGTLYPTVARLFSICRFFESRTVQPRSPRIEATWPIGGNSNAIDAAKNSTTLDATTFYAMASDRAGIQMRTMPHDVHDHGRFTTPQMPGKAHDYDGIGSARMVYLAILALAEKIR